MHSPELIEKAKQAFPHWEKLPLTDWMGLREGWILGYIKGFEDGTIDIGAAIKEQEHKRWWGEVTEEKKARFKQLESKFKQLELKFKYPELPLNLDGSIPQI